MTVPFYHYHYHIGIHCGWFEAYCYSLNVSIPGDRYVQGYVPLFSILLYSGRRRAGEIKSGGRLKNIMIMIHIYSNSP